MSSARLIFTEIVEKYECCTYIRGVSVEFCLELDSLVGCTALGYLIMRLGKLTTAGRYSAESNKV